jgi:hypothetical protein
MHAVKLLFLFAAIAFGASAADITGTWKAVFVNGDGPPKTVSEVILHLAADGERLRVTPIFVGCLGEAPVVEGKVAGDRISFTVYPNTRWWNGKSAASEEASGLPKLTFVGTVQGSEINFKLIWDSVMLYGKPPAGKEFLLNARRTTE